MRGSLCGDRPLIRLRFATAPSPTIRYGTFSHKGGREDPRPPTPSANRPDPIRKLVPDFRTPAPIGRARGRRQYPHPGIADQLQLFAIVSRAVEEFLSGCLAGECEELRTKCRDGI